MVTSVSVVAVVRVTVAPAIDLIDDTAPDRTPQQLRPRDLRAWKQIPVGTPILHRDDAAGWLETARLLLVDPNATALTPVRD
jgi:hypothetical protein